MHDNIIDKFAVKLFLRFKKKRVLYGLYMSSLGVSLLFCLFVIVRAIQGQTNQLFLNITQTIILLQMFVSYITSVGAILYLKNKIKKIKDTA